MDRVKAYIVGDSTVCAFSDGYYIPRYGYGTQLNNYFSGVEFINLAVSGRSSLSFLTDSFGNYQRLLSELGAGDFLIIGFGHNDEKGEAARYTNPNKSYSDESKEGGISFKNNLYKNYILPALERGATPILCTPIVRLNFKNDYSGSSGHKTPSGVFEGGDYAEAIRSLGKDAGVTVIDLTSATRQNYIELGAERAQNYHAFASCKGGVRRGLDTTHINKFGAKRVAYYFASQLKNSACPLKDYLIDELVAPEYDRDFADAINKDYREPEYKPFSPVDRSKNWAVEREGWFGTAFGDLDKALEAPHGHFDIRTEGEKFKISCFASGKIGDSEGIAAIFYRLPADCNFEFSATAEVESFANENQNGFGAMLRDTIYIDKSDSSIKDNYVAAGVFGGGGELGAIYCRQNEKIAPSGRRASGDFSSGSRHIVKIKKTNQAVELQFDEARFTYTDFDFVAVDNEFVYLTLYAAKNVKVIFDDVELKVTGKSVSA